MAFLMQNHCLNLLKIMKMLEPYSIPNQIIYSNKAHLNWQQQYKKDTAILYIVPTEGPFMHWHQTDAKRVPLTV